MLNKIMFQGRITGDIELRRTASGVPVTSFSMAVQRDIKGKDGERDVDFIDVVAWNHTAEFVQRYFGKGNMAVVVGRLQIRDWTDKQNNKRKTAEVVAEGIYFGDSKKANTGNPTANGGGFTEVADDGGDLPF